MALTYTAGIQDNIAQTVFGRSYADLDADEKKGMDGTSSLGGAPSGGWALRVYGRLCRIANYFDMVSTAQMPAEMDDWFTAETCVAVATAYHRSNVPELRKLCDDARSAFIESYSRTGAATFTSETGTFTLQTLRYDIIMRCVRLPKMFMPQIETVDRAIASILYKVWNEYRPGWTQRQVKITVPTTGTPPGSAPTMTYADGASFATNEVFGRVHSEFLYYTDDAAFKCAEMAGSGDRMARLLAQTTVSTGRPQFWRIEKRKDVNIWLWWPQPDTTYTLYGVIQIAMPGFPASMSDTATAMGFIPSEARHLIYDWAFAKVLWDHDREASQLKDSEVKAQADAMFRVTDDRGEGQQTYTQRDVYQDTLDVPSVGQPWIVGGGGYYGGGM